MSTLGLGRPRLQSAQASGVATLPAKSWTRRDAWQTTFAPECVWKTIPVTSLHLKRFNNLNPLSLTWGEIFYSALSTLVSAGKLHRSHKVWNYTLHYVAGVAMECQCQ